jgi:hypothetical protein
MKKTLIITNLFIILLSFCCIFNFKSNTITSLASNENTYSLINTYTNVSYSYLQSPSGICNNNDNFYIFSQNDNFLYEYDINNKLTKTNLSLSSFIKMDKYNNYLLLLTNNSLISFNMVDNTNETILTEQYVDFLIASFNDNSYIVTLNANGVINEYSISNDNHISLSLENSFSTNISDCLSFTNINNSYYIISKINTRPCLSSMTKGLINETKYINQISYNKNSNDFQMFSYNENLIIFEKNSSLVSIFNTKGERIIDLIQGSNNQDRSFISGEIYSPSYINVSGNKILICDDFCNSIQSFNIENNKLKFSNIILASQGYDNGRLYKPNDFIQLEDKIIICDTLNNRIVYNYEKNIVSTEQFVLKEPYLIATNNSDYIYVFDKNNNLTKFDINMNFISQNLINFTIDDLCSDSDNNIYALSISSGKILKYDENTHNFIDFIINLDLSSNAKLKISANGENLFIYTNNSISTYNIENKSNINIVSLPSQINSFIVDYKNNMYALSSNRIYSFKTCEYFYLSSNNLSNIKIDLVNGTFYFIDNDENSIKKLDSLIANNLQNFEYDNTYFNSTALKDSVNIYKVNENCQIYAYPFNIKSIHNLTQNDKVILLNEKSKENSKFSYIMVTNYSKQNILGYIENSKISKITDSIKIGYDKIRVIIANASIYKYPTTLPVPNQNNILKLVSQNTIFNVISYSYDIQDSMSNKFFEIKLDDNSYGYINRESAINNDLKSYQKVFQTNAKLITFNNEEKITTYNFNNDKYVQNTFYLDENKRIFLEENLDTNKEYTKIVYLNNNNEQVSTYVLTKNIQTDKLTFHQILGFILLGIALILLIILPLLLTKYKKNKKYSE